MGLRSIAACGAIVSMAAVGSGTALAESDFYRGKQISIIVGFVPGGGYDLNARAVGRHISRHVPGEPSVIVRNMPGAGSLNAMNYLYTLAPKDGTEFGTFARNLPIEPLLGGKGAQFEALRFNWIGSSSNEVSTCVAWHTSPIRTMSDLMQREMTVGASGEASSSAVYPRLLNTVLGTKFKVITGYRGSSETLLAMERGEVESFCSWGWVAMKATRGEWLRDGKIRVLVQTGMRKERGHEDVPLALDLAPSDEARRVMELVFAPQAFARPFAAPPDLPEGRAAILRAAFASTMRDADFLADAAKQKLVVELVPGEDIHAMLTQLYRSPPEVIAGARAALGRN